MKASMMCGMAKVKRRKIPNLLLGICIMATAALLVNALVFLRELDPIFDRAYEGMEGPQMCCLWSKGIVSCDTVGSIWISFQMDSVTRSRRTPRP